MAKKGYLFEKETLPFKDYGWEYIQDLNEFSTSVNWMTEQMMIFLMTMNQELKCWKE